MGRGKGAPDRRRSLEHLDHRRLLFRHRSNSLAIAYGYQATETGQDNLPSDTVVFDSEAELSERALNGHPSGHGVDQHGRGLG